MAKDKKKSKDKKDKMEKANRMIPFGTYSGNESFLNKDTDMSIEDRIYSIPPSTYEFNVNRQYVLDTTGITSKYDNEFVLVKSVFDDGYYGAYNRTNYVLINIELEDGTTRPATSEELGEINTYRPIMRKYSDDCANVEFKKSNRTYEHTAEYVGEFVPSIKDAFNSNVIKHSVQAIRRSEVEYNPRYLQYVSAVVVESENKILVLKSTAGRLKGKLTMVQGHVEYSKNYLTSTFLEFVRDNAWKELHEEVTNVDTSNLSIDPIILIDKNANLIDSEHLGLVYKYTTTDEEIMKIETNESDKHEVLVIDKSDLHKDEYIRKYDSWLTDVINIMYLNK